MRKHVRKHMETHSNQQRTGSRLGVKLVVSGAILAATIVLSPTKALAFTLVGQPVSAVDAFAPVDPGSDQTVRLNAANVFCPTATESVMVLFKFFSGDGRTLKEETKPVACGDVASSELPFIERPEVGSPHVYALIAVLPAVQRPGHAPRGFCPSDVQPGQERSAPLVTSFEIRGHGTGGGGGAGEPVAVTHQILLPAVHRSCGR
jgi:hypothetical protein